jgi:hypothetical protein
MHLSLCVHRATAQSETGIIRGCGVAEAPPVFQAGWFDLFIFYSLLFIQLPVWNFRVSVYAYEGTVPYRSSAQMFCRLMTKQRTFLD